MEKPIYDFLEGYNRGTYLLKESDWRRASLTTIAVDRCPWQAAALQNPFNAFNIN
jgi:hypothetical protein